ncbi:MAG: hypothetical protein JWM58_3217, partial [Rhizobium sp.]|nr:hypothetical protein [Rhizobium sp.]
MELLLHRGFSTRPEAKSARPFGWAGIRPPDASQSSTVTKVTPSGVLLPGRSFPVPRNRSSSSR